MQTDVWASGYNGDTQSEAPIAEWDIWLGCLYTGQTHMSLVYGIQPPNPATESSALGFASAPVIEF